MNMAGLTYWIICCHILSQTISVLAIQQLAIRTNPGYLDVRWRISASPPEKWNIAYSVTGTGYHSFLSVNGTDSSVNITTHEYPGILYAVQLFSSTNGSSALTGRGFARADCSHKVEMHIGDTIQVESPGYPNNPVRGQICTWNVAGSNQTWYKVSFKDIDYGNGQSCNNYLKIEDNVVCDNGTLNETLVVPKNSMKWTFLYGQGLGGKGFKANITAIWKIEKPENLTASLIDDVITVTWLDPQDCPPGFFHVLRLSHYPHTTHADLALPGNSTSHDFNVTQHAGQNFTFQVKISTQDSSGEFSDPVTIETDCDKSVYIRHQQTVVLTSNHFPFQYLPGVHCHYKISTRDDNFLKTTVDTLDIDGGTDCVSGHLEMGRLGKFCSDSPPPVSSVISSPRLSLTFVTGSLSLGKGFNLTIKSIAKPPSAPYNLMAKTEARKIFLHWHVPSLRSQYVTSYTVQYSVLPSSASISIHVPKNSTTAVIPTDCNSGRLFTFRVIAYSEGGMSDSSKPCFARASCGSAFHLTRLTSAFIMSPLDQQHNYQPGVVCVWSITTLSPLWLHVEIAKINLEFSNKCSKDYMYFSSSHVGKVCGENLTGKAFVVKQTQMNVTFVTDYSTEREGFTIKITSVGPSPTEPSSVKLVQSAYSLIVSWEPPSIHRQYLTGYLLKYRLHGNSTIQTDRLLPQHEEYAIDTTDTPGSLYEVWVQSEGDESVGDSSAVVKVHAACGQNYSLKDERIYIASPHYPHSYGSNIRCQWHLMTMENASVTVIFRKVDLKNVNGCTDNITISDFGVICNDSVENNGIILNDRSARNISITFQTDDSEAGSGFMMFVERTQIFASPLQASRRQTISESVRLEPSPTIMLSSSATSLLLTSAISRFISSETITSLSGGLLQPTNVFASVMRAKSRPDKQLNSSFNINTTEQRTKNQIAKGAISKITLVETSFCCGSVSLQHTPQVASNTLFKYFSTEPYATLILPSLAILDSDINLTWFKQVPVLDPTPRSTFQKSVVPIKTPSLNLSSPNNLSLKRSHESITLFMPSSETVFVDDNETFYSRETKNWSRSRLYTVESPFITPSTDLARSFINPYLSQRTDSNGMSKAIKSLSNLQSPYTTAKHQTRFITSFIRTSYNIFSNRSHHVSFSPTLVSEISDTNTFTQTFLNAKGNSIRGVVRSGSSKGKLHISSAIIAFILFISQMYLMNFNK